ncbi:MAG: 3-hydroxyacyl-CoA dehydrogenase family protein [Dehalococcoidia bacterium]|nr:3-hydroxyacyl-CoA dehydrogenase family protein [Dehalococcoidia bacterium]
MPGIKHIAVIGAGVMGPGIAISFARHGFPVALADIDPAALERASKSINSMACLFDDSPTPGKGGRKAIAARISLTSSIEEAAGKADFIVEAVKEELTVKSRVFADLEKVCPPHAILASNSSTLSIDNIVEKISHKERTILTHFVNPPEVMPIVEVARGSATSDEKFADTVNLIQLIGKKAIICDKVVPGYLVNSFNMAIMGAALDFLGREVATLEEIDSAFTQGLGPRLSVMGPFKTMDLIGLDLIWQAVLSFDPNAHNDPRATRLRELVQAGHFGMKTGKGFYDYGGRSRDEVMQEIDRQLLDIVSNRPAGTRGGTHTHGIQ